MDKWGSRLRTAPKALPGNRDNQGLPGQRGREAAGARRSVRGVPETLEDSAGLVYGRNSVLEALRAGRVERIHMARGARGAVSEIVGEAAARGIPISEADRDWLNAVAGGDHHQGVAAVVTPYRYSSLDAMLALARKRGEPPWLLILDCVQDPQNLGTLLRTAEAVAVHGIVLPEHRAAHVTPAVEKASAGAVEHLLVARETNLTKTILRLRDEGLWVAGVEAVPGAVDFRKASLAGPLAIVVGSEGKGISRLVRESCDFLVSLPMKGVVSSLNAGVAGSVVLYEVLRQRTLSVPDQAHADLPHRGG